MNIFKRLYYQYRHGVDFDLYRAWIDDLRSGEFKQGRYMLMRGGPSTESKSFCCLGVVCATAAWSGPEISVETLQEQSGSSDTHIRSGSALYKRLGFHLDAFEFHNQLVRMNDGEGNTFPQIADFIEEKVFG